MNGFNYIKAIGFGALIWAIMYAFASAIVGFGATIGIGWTITFAIVGGAVAYLFAVNVKSETVGQAIAYGVFFAGVGIILDAIITQQFVTGLFRMWMYYIGYALVLLAPLAELGFNGGNERKALPR